MNHKTHKQKSLIHESTTKCSFLFIYFFVKLIFIALFTFSYHEGHQKVPWQENEIIDIFFCSGLCTTVRFFFSVFFPKNWLTDNCILLLTCPTFIIYVNCSLNVSLKFHPEGKQSLHFVKSRYKTYFHLVSDSKTLKIYKTRNTEGQMPEAVII